MEEINAQYDPVRMDNIRLFLKRAVDSGSPRYYRISIDSVPVVEKTNDLSRFNDYEDYMYEGTKEMKVLVFSHAVDSPKVCYKYIFSLEKPEEKKPQAQTMSGFGLGEIEAKINEKVSEKVSIERERWDCEQVKKELEATKGKVEEAEEYIEKLKGKIADAEKNLQDAKSMGDIAAVIKELAPHVLSFRKAPETNLSGSEKKPEAEASFSKTSEPKLSENDKRYLQFGKMLEGKFSEPEFDAVYSIVEKLSADKSKIKTISELLNDNLKTKTHEKI